jgi:hypothetical protein
VNKDHLVIHKQDSLNANVLTHYLVNTYFDYAQTHYFLTRKDAKTFVEHYKEAAE